MKAVVSLLLVISVLFASPSFATNTADISPPKLKAEQGGVDAQTAAAVVPLDKPNMDDTALLAWASQAASFGFADYNEAFEKTQRNYTPEGWKNFQASLEKSGFLKDMVQNQQVILLQPDTSASADPPSVENEGLAKEGVYEWTVSIPVVEEIRSGNVASTHRASITGSRVILPESSRWAHARA